MTTRNEIRLSTHYHDGYNARKWGNAKVPPGALNWRDRHWWMAGWNDHDVEIQAQTPEKARS